QVASWGPAESKRLRPARHQNFHFTTLQRRVGNCALSGLGIVRFRGLISTRLPIRDCRLFPVPHRTLTSAHGAQRLTRTELASERYVLSLTARVSEESPHR